MSCSRAGKTEEGSAFLLVRRASKGEKDSGGANVHVHD